jgi:isoprenylcysteine carboxyl methyltransferase (ICMT) family protein YpbQ
MTSKTALKSLFILILLSMIVCTGFASSQQSVFAWGGLTTGPDRYWTIATLCDAYFGFLTFYVWVAYKETRWLPRVVWFLAIMALGNMAMATYVLLQLMRLRADQPASAILTARNAP